MPHIIRSSSELSRLWRETVERCRQVYSQIATTLAKNELLEKTIQEAREALRLLRTAARSILPNATETKIVFTGNARALRHFLAVRGSVVGDEEMRLVCSLILEGVSAEAPALFQDFYTSVLPDGLPAVYQRPAQVR